MIFIKGLKNLSKNDVLAAGGKGASLGEMTRAGIPVPPGFVVLSSAFESFLSQGIRTKIKAVLDKVVHTDVKGVETASKTIQALILSTPVPKEISIAILNAFKHLRATCVAVRSSATSEDSASAAWAGQLDSYLNTTEKELFMNVRKCWASLFTPRAIFYRFEQKLQKKEVSVAVVVQKIVESEAAGVAFSVHPVTQDRNQMIIEAGFGLGESLVSGQITPDNYVVDKKSFRIIDKTVNTQTKGMYRSAKGNEWKQLGKKGTLQKISNEQIITLSTIVAKIEQHYGFPVDVEWALEKNKFYIVQSRPITTLTQTIPSGREEIKIEPSKKFPCVETYPEKPDIADKYEKYICANDKWYPKGIKTHLLLMIPQGFAAAAGVSAVHNIGFRLGFATYEDQYMKWSYDPRDFYEIGKDLIQKNKADPAWIQEYVSSFWRESEEFILKASNVYWNYASKDKSDIKRKFTDIVNSAVRAQAYGYITEVFTLTENYWVNKYVKELAPDLNEAEITALLHPSTSSFVKVFQQKLLSAQDEADFKSILKDYYWVKGSYYTMPILTLKDLKKEKKDTKSSHEKLPDKKMLIQKSLHPEELLRFVEMVEKCIAMQDERKANVLRLNYALQKLATLIHGINQKYSVDDLLSFTPREIILLLEGRPMMNMADLINKRNKRSVWIFTNEGYCITSDQVYINKYLSLFDTPLANKEIKGYAASPGRAKGIVKIVLSEKDFWKIENGDILVTSMTRPEFMPVLHKAAAFLTDEGGITSHAAIVSREMRKPCIIGTKIATQVLKDGDLVEVDANTGIVRILKKRDEEHSIQNFTKLFTRDFSMIALEIAAISESSDDKPWHPGKIPYRPLNLIERSDGTSTYWYNEKGLDWTKSTLASAVKKDGQFIAKVEREVRSAVAFFKPRYNKFLSRNELLQCIDVFLRAYPWIEAMWWMKSMNAQEIGKDHGKILKLRAETETLSADTDIVIRKSLEKLYPKLGSLSSMISLDELRKNKVPANSVLQKRLDGFVLVDGKLTMQSLTEVAKKLTLTIESESIETNATTLNGQTAYPGKVRGTVCRVMGHGDFGKIKSGQILVSPMTMVDFLPEIKKASAIITNEGGVTCHAAIVSRELKIPCVIGTKFATQVLKDGDEVEVNANSGIITILNTNNTHLANQFISSLGSDQLCAPQFNSSLFVQASGWNTTTYHKKHYKHNLGFPIFLGIKEGEGFMYYPLSAMKRYSYEIFEGYCRNAAILKDKEQQFEKLSAKFDVLYRKTNYAFIQKTKNSELYVLIDKIRDLVWDLNTLVKFSIYFDKEMCLETINKTGLKISDHRLNEIWERATTPIALSFEKRRMLHLLTLIRENYAWDVISERCQYFEANYHHVASIVEVTKKLKSTYGNLSKNQALKILQKENTELRQRHKDFNQWFKTLTKDEQLVVVYLQKVIELRDERKDDLNKAIVLFYRIAQKTFKEANIPEELIYYYTLDEIIKGKGHLIANKDSLFKRKNGFCAIITHDNQQHFEYGFYKENKRILEEQYRAQEADAHSDNMLKGQTGASGKIRGTVKVIRNLFADQYKFKQGDILVTGMTRPEFVPLMKKASGFITDEGGITCHAAIVAREMKKPCVIGTKIATQVLKDNDYVEVDADAGVVRRLKQPMSAQRNEYHQLFRFEQMPFFINDTLLQNYKSLKCLFLYDGESWWSYLPKESVISAMEEGVILFGDDHKFKEYTNLFEQYKNASRKIFKKIIAQKTVSLNDIKTFIEYISTLHRYYIKTEHFYTDKAFTLSKKNSILKKNLKQLERVKNEGRAYLNEVFLQPGNYITKVLIMISKQFGTSIETVLQYSQEEIIQLFSNQKISDKIVSERQLAYVTQSDGATIKVLTGKSAKEFVKEFHEKEKDTLLEFKGVAANPGIAVGRAFVVFYGYDSFHKVSELIKDMQKGDVLVAETTSPEIMVACKKAGAIVTNQGGLLSHAAIISRELKIPCIVGTENATSILKTGDLVEVNANTGTVTKIKSPYKAEK